jgi:hypothetical protein
VTRHFPNICLQIISLIINYHNSSGSEVYIHCAFKQVGKFQKIDMALEASEPERPLSKEEATAPKPP